MKSFSLRTLITRISFGLPMGIHVRLSFASLLAMVLSFSIAQSSHACGIIWNMTPSHFADVDNQGNVHLIQKVGEMESLAGLRMPIFAIFESAGGNRSPFAGDGWKIPLLESRIIQFDENRFCVFQPDGFQRMFRRDKKDPNVLLSRDTWKAEIRGETITAYCRCQTQRNKLVFRKGRLISIEVKEGKFDYVYKGDRVAEIREGVRTVLKVEKKPLTENIEEMTLLNGQKIWLERSQHQRVQVLGDQKKIEGILEGLSRIITTNGATQTFVYGVDDNLNPTLKLNDREIVWDAATGRVMRDGEWNYSISPGPRPGDYAAIARSNARNEKEFWHKDYAKGEEITEDIDGVKKITTWFNSGKLRGMTRKELEIKDGVKRTLCEYSYDEKGRLIRIRRELTDTFFVFQDDGQLAAVVMNGEIVRHYTTNATVLAEKYVK